MGFGVLLGCGVAVADGVALGAGVGVGVEPGPTIGVEVGLGLKVGVGVGVAPAEVLPAAWAAAPVDSKNCLFSPNTQPERKRVTALSCTALSIDF